MSTNFNYSDGVAIENRIRHLIEQSADVRSTTSVALAEYANWPVRYHLSAQRSHLVRHLNFEGADVLELGAGMGGVSRFLAESARRLTVVEGSALRYAALQARLRDLDNWQGQIANIQDAKLADKYDVVCVIGVLEYSELYFEPTQDEDAFTCFLRKAMSFLKDDGVLVLAIENKLGLKYWSGAAEDHTGRLFDGICDYPLSKSPKTFSRKELIEKVRSVGLSKVEVQYPFPDYKLPSSVITEELINVNAQLAGDLACSEVFSAHNLPKINFFSDVLAMESLVKAGLIADFSNSFLVIASSDGSSKTLTQLLHRQHEKGEVAWHYANSRKRPTETIFYKAENKIWVQKKAMLASSESAEETLLARDTTFKWNALALQCASEGKIFSTHLLKRAYFEEWEFFLRDFKVFLSWSFEHWKIDSSEDNKIDGRALDAGINNAHLKSPIDDSYDNTVNAQVSGETSLFELFDLEWCVEGGMSRSWFILRNILNLGPQRVEFMKRNSQFNSFKELYELFCKALDVPANLALDARSEALFLSAARDEHISNQEIEHAVRRVFPSSQFARLPVEEHHLRTQFKRLQQLLPGNTAAIGKRAMKFVRKLQMSSISRG